MNNCEGMTRDEFNSLQEGDTIKIVSGFSHGVYNPANGDRATVTGASDLYWNSGMEDIIGDTTTVRVIQINQNTVKTQLGHSYDHWYFPYWCLKLVEKKQIKEMTVKEISDELGYDVKIVK